MMDWLQETVVHERFGEGKVVSFDGKVLTAHFADYGARSFVYPSAFEKFLKAANPELQQAALKDLSLELERTAEKRALAAAARVPAPKKPAPRRSKAVAART